MQKFDVIIIGAGASGVWAAARAVAAKKSVCVIDMGTRPLRKVAVSGGGKCNFTNARANSEHYFGKNPEFTRGPLARFSWHDMLDWGRLHNIKFYEKTPGRYFAESARVVIDALLHDARGANFVLNTRVLGVHKNSDDFIIATTNGDFITEKLVVATGGMSYANLGVDDIGYKIAKQFGHKIIPPRPGLCAMRTNVFGAGFSGVSLNVEIKIGHEIILDEMLFTHFGIGGPAIYRTSVRDISHGFVMNLLPGRDAFDWLKQQKKLQPKKQMKNVLSGVLPERVAEFFADGDTRNIADFRDNELRDLSEKMTNIKFSPADFNLQKFDAAEITCGGVDTREISSKTMKSKLCPGLYFIGEVLDIAGDLGGFNLQWAWSSANALEM